MTYSNLLIIKNEQSQYVIPSHVYDKEFSKYAEELGFHIYMLLVSPKVSVKRKKVKKSSVTFEVDNGSFKKVVKIPIAYKDKLEFMNEVEILDEIIKYYISEGRNKHADSLIEKFRKYKVCYIGKAYSEKGRTAVDRLRGGHEHLQEILAKIHDYSSGNTQVGVILLNVVEGMRSAQFTIHHDSVREDSEKISQSIKYKLDKKSAIDLAEGGLIGYFKPEENDNRLEFPAISGGKYGELQKNPQGLIDSGFTHLGIDIDLRQSRVVLEIPESSTPWPLARISYNLKNCKKENPPPSSSSTMDWRMDKIYLQPNPRKVRGKSGYVVGCYLEERKVKRWELWGL
mgnify:FL=1